MTDQVAAVVVTYNRVDKLGRVLDSILAQTRPVDRLIVIDNASTDSTPQLLAVYDDDPRVEVVRLDSNTGGAGGFSAGMERAYERGADWVWIMDDDCYTEESALEKLLAGHSEAEEGLGRNVPYSCSLVRYTDGSICEMNNAGRHLGLGTPDRPGPTGCPHHQLFLRLRPDSPPVHRKVRAAPR